MGLLSPACGPALIVDIRCLRPSVQDQKTHRFWCTAACVEDHDRRRSHPIARRTRPSRRSPPSDRRNHPVETRARAPGRRTRCGRQASDGDATVDGWSGGTPEMTPAEVHLLADEIWDIGKRYEQSDKRDIDVMTILKHAAT